MRPAWDGIAGWLLVLACYALLIYGALALDRITGVHLLALALGAAGVALIRYRARLEVQQ